MSEVHECCICFQPMTHPYIEDDYLGNDAYPVKDGRCCDLCDCTVVLPARMRRPGTMSNAALFMMQTSIIGRVAKIRLKAEIGLLDHPDCTEPEWINRLMEIEKEMHDTAIPFCFQEDDDA